MEAAEDPATEDAVPDLTPAERAKLRALLQLLDRAALGVVDRPRLAKVEPIKPTAEDFAELRARRRRRTHRHG